MNEQINIGDTVHIGRTSLRGKVLDIHYTDENAILELKINYPQGWFVAFQAYQMATKVSA
jgi:hypothetical protein